MGGMQKKDRWKEGEEERLNGVCERSRGLKKVGLA